MTATISALWNHVRSLLDSTTTANVLAITMLLAWWLGQRVFTGFVRTALGLGALTILAYFIFFMVRVARRYLTHVIHNKIDYIVEKVVQRVASMGASRWYIVNTEITWHIHDPHGSEATVVKKVEGYCTTAGANTYEENCISNGILPERSDCSISDGDVIAVRSLRSDASVHAHRSNADSFEVISLLSRTYVQGERFQFVTRRRIQNGFDATQEWVSTKIVPSTHGNVCMRVRFPQVNSLRQDTVRLELKGAEGAEALRAPEVTAFQDDNGKVCPEIVAHLTDVVRGDEYIIHWEWNPGGAAAPSP